MDFLKTYILLQINFTLKRKMKKSKNRKRMLRKTKMRKQKMKKLINGNLG